MYTDLFFTILGIGASICAHFASKHFEVACHKATERSVSSFYEKLASSVLYYGNISVPLVITIIYMLSKNISFVFNSEHSVYFIVMLFGYASVIIFDMLSRQHVNTTTFNVVCALQMLGMLATRWYVFGHSMVGLQWVGAVVATIAIMSITYSSSKEEQHIGGNTTLGIIYVMCAAGGRSIAITMDSFLSNRMFAPMGYCDNFSAPWWLYECITFVGPATLVFMLMYLIYKLNPQEKQKPWIIIGTELRSGNYTVASIFSFGEYILGVPKLSALPNFGPILQSTVPLVGILDDWWTGQKPQRKIIYMCCLLILGALLLVFGK